MTVSRMAYSCRVAGTAEPVPVLGGTVALDESWSPYVTGTLRLALGDAGALADADPRNGDRVQLRASQQFNSAFPLADITADVGGTMADWTSTLTGGPLSNWTGRYATAYNPTGLRPSRVRNFDLGIRSRRVSWERGEVELTLASDEALLQDDANLEKFARTPATETIRGAVALALSAIGAAAVFETDDVTLESGSAAWEPGVSAWDYVQPLVDAVGLRLWCDERRTWHLSLPNAARGAALTFTEETLTGLDSTISRDEEWADAVHVTYRWRDGSDIEQVRYSTAAVAGYSRVRSLTYDRPYPGPYAASSILARARGRGRVQQARAVMNPTATPGQPVVIGTSALPVQTGYLQQVQFRLDNDDMQVTTRDLTDTPEDAWVLVPAGIAWADVPAGTSWDEYSTADLEGA